MNYELMPFFDSLEDKRRKQGQRHQFRDILTIIIMAILSGHQGLKRFTRFANANAEELTEVLKLKHGVPKYSTFQALLKDLDEQILITKFIEWVESILPESVDNFIALDGKAIRATTYRGNTKLQNFVAVVSAFGQQSGLVYEMNSYENGKSGEAQALRDLVNKLGLTNKFFTMDALHCQKKKLVG